MKPIEINFSFLGETYKARFCRNEYFNENLYVGVTYWDEEFECWMPWGDLTVNLPGFLLEENEAFLDTNNCAPEIIRILKEKGYIKDTGVTRQSGFCTYPLVEFTEEFFNGIEDMC